MQGLENLEELTGVCRYCGQTRIVKAADQAEADERVSLDCSCPGADMARQKKELKDRLSELIGELAPEYGWEPTDPDTFDSIWGIASCVAEGKISSVGLRIGGSNLKIGRKQGRLSIERSKTIKQGGTIEK